jgi:hypothetical protein
MVQSDRVQAFLYSKGQMNMNLAQTLSQVPAILSYGFIGLAVLMALLFFGVLQKKLSVFQHLVGLLVTMLVLIGGLYLEYLKVRPSSIAGNCLMPNGEIGLADLSIGIYNPDGTSHGWHENKLVVAGDLFVSAYDVADIQSKTTSDEVKRWGAAWTCVSP